MCQTFYHITYISIYSIFIANMLYYGNLEDEETEAQTNFTKFVSYPAVNLYKWNSKPVVSDSTVYALYSDINRERIIYCAKEVISQNKNFRIVKGVEEWDIVGQYMCACIRICILLLT